MKFVELLRELEESWNGVRFTFIDREEDGYEFRDNGLLRTLRFDRDGNHSDGQLHSWLFEILEESKLPDIRREEFSTWEETVLIWILRAVRRSCK